MLESEKRYKLLPSGKMKLVKTYKLKEVLKIPVKSKKKKARKY